MAKCLPILIGLAVVTATIRWTASVDAAAVTFGTSIPITGLDTDVLNAGTTVNATNIDGNTVVVNGVTFTGASGATVTQGNMTSSITGGWTDPGAPYGSLNAPFAAMSANMQNLLASGDYQDSANTATIAYTGLIFGHQYVFQYFVNDSRGFGGTNNRVLNLTAPDAGSNSVNLTPFDVSGTDGGLGVYTVGAFTADVSGTQSITVGPGTGNEQQNAF